MSVYNIKIRLDQPDVAERIRRPTAFSTNHHGFGRTYSMSRKSKARKASFIAFGVVALAALSCSAETEVRASAHVLDEEALIRSVEQWGDRA